MKQFTNLLKELNNKINLPQPKKSQVILEIAADLNDLYNLYLQRGLSETEAAQKARDKFELSDEIITDLSEIHTSTYRQWVEKVFGKTQDIYERILLTLLFLFVALSVVFAVITTPFFSKSSTFVFPVLVSLTGVLITWGAKFYQLYIKKDHAIKQIRFGLSLFKFFGVANLFLCLSGYFTELYLYGTETLFLGPLFIMLLKASDGTLPQVIDFLLKSSSLIMICLFVAMVTGILWLTIIQKINSIEQAEAEILLAE